MLNTLAVGTLKLSPQPEIYLNGLIRRSCKIILSENKSVEEKLLYIDLPNALSMTLRADDCNAYLMMILLVAMSKNYDIHIGGSVDSILLTNLTEYMRAWSLWMPSTYGVVKIIPDEINTSQFSPHAVATAFSGGLDASFTVWDYIHSQHSPALKFGVMVHGFDIPLFNTKGFLGAFNNAKIH